MLNASNENEAGQIYEGVVLAYKVKNLIHSTQENDKKLLGLGEDFKPKFFRTSSGEAYGFVKDGKIYIDPRIATSETPVHEYHHLWVEALEKANPEAWGSTKSKPYIYTLEEIELSDGHNDAVESGHTRKSDRTISFAKISV